MSRSDLALAESGGWFVELTPRHASDIFSTLSSARLSSTRPLAFLISDRTSTTLYTIVRQNNTSYFSSKIFWRLLFLEGWTFGFAEDMRGFGGGGGRASCRDSFHLMQVDLVAFGEACAPQEAVRTAEHQPPARRPVDWRRIAPSFAHLWPQQTIWTKSQTSCFSFIILPTFFHTEKILTWEAREDLDKHFGRQVTNTRRALRGLFFNFLKCRAGKWLAWLLDSVSCSTQVQEHVDQWAHLAFDTLHQRVAEHHLHVYLDEEQHNAQQHAFELYEVIVRPDEFHSHFVTHVCQIFFFVYFPCLNDDDFINRMCVGVLKGWMKLFETCCECEKGLCCVVSCRVVLQNCARYVYTYFYFSIFLHPSWCFRNGSMSLFASHWRQI